MYILSHAQEKITVVNVEDNNNINAENTDNTEPVLEQIETTPEEPAVEEVTVPVEDDRPVEDKPIEDKPIEDKKIRSQQLIRCPKCDKMVTEKTLKYSHARTCKGEEHNKI